MESRLQHKRARNLMNVRLYSGGSEVSRLILRVSSPSISTLESHPVLKHECVAGRNSARSSRVVRDPISSGSLRNDSGELQVRFRWPFDLRHRNVRENQ